MMPNLPSSLVGGIQLKRLVQIGIVVGNRDRTTQLLTSLFGIGPFRFVEWPDRPESKYYYRGVEESVRIKQAFVQLGEVEVEIIQPVEGSSGYKDFLNQNGGGIHHLLFEVSDIDPVIEELAKSGVTVLQSGSGIRPGTRWALLDTKDLLGFLVELRHRPGESDGTSVP
ncbi:MAG: methylmalonyl-CoA/ethylmalonyl-CoA epimerase [Candidatus Sulfotelmatobacter sp.]|nr:methylmalonyl-CoA/ethylmalonyl-CoA epimerase [Candidatus Sulfotelmatobacter sp.]